MLTFLNDHSYLQMTCRFYIASHSSHTVRMTSWLYRPFLIKGSIASMLTETRGRILVHVFFNFAPFSHAQKWDLSSNKIITLRISKSVFSKLFAWKSACWFFDNLLLPYTKCKCANVHTFLAHFVCAIRADDGKGKHKQ